MKPTKTTYIRMMTVITILCVVFGTLYHMGNFFYNIGALPVTLFRNTGIAAKNVGSKESFEDVQSIDLKVDCMEVTMKSHAGEKVLLSYSGQEKLRPEFSFHSGKLEIKQKKKGKVNLASIESKLTIELPEGKPLDRLSVDIDMGNIEMEDFDTEKFDLNLDMGNVEGKDFTAEKMDIDADMGNVTFEDVQINNLTADADMGNVIIHSKKDLSNHTFTCKADLGNIEINGDNVGKTWSASGSEGKYELETDLGNISVDY